MYKKDKDMQSIATTFSRWIRWPEIAVSSGFSARRLLRRHRYFIESTDWDEKILHQKKWVDGLCLGLIILSLLYFTPVLIFTLLK